ncbi:UNVERIFIED_CONTAM: hypothetical protein GTU68_062790 [Idotea baltica]|nr:hypothetical protein [Idotea baltica]
MHGLGNDFVIIDARGTESPVSQSMARAIGERHFGVGYDQLAVLTDSADADVDVAFWNSDGSMANACGNASRCVARIIMDETGDSSIILRTGNGLLPTLDAGDGLISVNMGQPQLTWDTIPLSKDVDLNALPIKGEPGAAGMGNPHCVFVVDDAEGVNLETRGPAIEHHPLFPERTNVEFIEIKNRNTIRMRVWERGGMITLACGSGACAAAVVAHRKGLIERNVTIQLDGGNLQIDWRDDGVWMTGPTALVFQGHLSPEFLAGI